MFSIAILLYAAFAPCPLDETVTVEQLIEAHAKVPAVNVKLKSLSPEWVGTVRLVHGEDTTGMEKENHIRFHKGSARTDSEGKTDVMIFRMSSAGQCVGSEMPKYIASLPSLEELKAINDARKLVELFGSQTGFTDAWRDGEVMNSTMGWSFFTKTEEKQLRYLTIFAMVSHTKGKEEIAIRKLMVREGFFRHADPDSKEELDKYLNGDQLFLAKAQEQIAKLSKHPQPLRDLLIAKEVQRSGYNEIIEKYRENPDPVLIQQIVGYCEERSVSGIGIAEDILLGRIEEVVWEKAENKPKIAGFLVDAMSETEDQSIHVDIAHLLLRIVGGGEVKALGAKVRLMEGGYQRSYGTRPPESSVASAQLELKELLEAKFGKQ